MKRTLSRAALLAAVITVSAQENDSFKVLAPPHYRELVEMADCRSVGCLVSRRKGLPDSEKMVNLVFFTKQMLLRPNTEAAKGLLRSIPSNEREQLTFMYFPVWHDGATKSVHDLTALGRIYDRWPRVVAKAALLNPDLILDYVGYLRLAPNDIHSDFAADAESVCEKHPLAFRKALHALPEDDQAYIAKVVFDASLCRAIFRSEAE